MGLPVWPALALAAALLPPAVAAEPLAAASAAAPASAPSLAEAAASIPPSVQLSYQVQARVVGIPVTAQAALDWRQDGARYTAHWTFSGPFGLRREQSSAGALTPHGLAPEQFSERGRTAHFERAQGRITFSDMPPAELAPGAQDRLSVSVQLGALIAAAPERYPPGTQVALQVAGARGADVWTFTVQGDETLQLGGQTLPCVKLERSGAASDQQLTLWLARARNYLPVRLRMSQPNGDLADQQLTRLRRTGSEGNAQE